MKVPAWYWVFAVLAVLWMLVGVAAWWIDFLMTPDMLAQMPEAQQQLYAARPEWLFAVYGVAIFSGLLGAIGLLFRRAWAVPALALSLAAIVVQFGYTFIVLDAMSLLGPSALIFPLVIFGLGVLFLWLAVHARRRGWLGPR